jgi:hypothetical protein
MKMAATIRILFLWATAFTVIFELITCWTRFGFRLESTRDTASTIGRLTCGLRIHHSYIGGVIMLLACWLWDRHPKTSWMLAIGLGLFFSDLIHHFLVLWPVVGSPQFDVFYPLES